MCIYMFYIEVQVQVGMYSTKSKSHRMVSYVRKVFKTSLQFRSPKSPSHCRVPKALNIYRIVKADGSRAMQQLERLQKGLEGGKQLGRVLFHSC